mmetsp:Transcript_33665/g.85060  ORF Transcript_33665/g.85060 Transcript_33665/m.85060 type:complete len:201 (-) Transcript_33665:1274-1876(-)
MEWGWSGGADARLHGNRRRRCCCRSRTSSPWETRLPCPRAAAAPSPRAAPWPSCRQCSTERRAHRACPQDTRAACTSPPPARRATRSAPHLADSSPNRGDRTGRCRSRCPCRPRASTRRASHRADPKSRKTPGSGGGRPPHCGRGRTQTSACAGPCRCRGSPAKATPAAHAQTSQCRCSPSAPGCPGGRPRWTKRAARRS